MTRPLSSAAQEFLRGDHVGVIGTLNPDGSSHLTTIWYLLADNGTVVMSTPSRTRKVKNLRRDPRIAFCVGDGSRSVSLYGHVTISQDPTRVREAIEQLVERYIQPEGVRAQAVATFVQQSRVTLSFTPEKVTEFSVEG